jgi:hypothetical protein
MNKTIITTAAAVAFILVVGAVTAYIAMFGASPAGSQALWAQFGDFFGGLLNPLFAMLAFLALLWSISLQAHESRVASEHLAAQAEAARQQLKILVDDRLREDLLHVVKDIDSRLKQLLETNVSTSGSYPQVTIALMVAEGRRIASGGEQSAAYSIFVKTSRTPGTVVEAPIREIIDLVGKMREFLGQYSRFAHGSYSPFILYYADKCYRLLDMLEEIGGLPDDTRQFYATISDAHG